MERKPQFKFKRTPAFRRAFDNFTPQQQKAAKKCFSIFKWNIRDPRLNTHLITKLTAKRKTPIWSVTIEADLKAVFSRDGDTIISEDIGKHSIYQ